MAPIILLAVIGLVPNAQAREKAVKILSPKRNEKVSGSSQIKLKVGAETRRVDVYIDGEYLRSGPPYTIRWHSTDVSDGPHTITVVALGGTTAVASVVGSESSGVQHVPATESAKVRVRNEKERPASTYSDTDTSARHTNSCTANTDTTSGDTNSCPAYSDTTSSDANS